MTPFLLRFSDPIPAQPTVPLAYDRARQVALVESDGGWVEATALAFPMPHTRMTKVQSETTDDN